MAKEKLEVVKEADAINTFSIGLAIAEQLSVNSNLTQTLSNTGDVLFNVSYSKDFKGEKTMPVGLVIVSKESAEHFTSIGIGKIAE